MNAHGRDAALLLSEARREYECGADSDGFPGQDELVELLVSFFQVLDDELGDELEPFLRVNGIRIADGGLVRLG